jgi:tetratricopeptide (TPR) repeat protein
MLMEKIFFLLFLSIFLSASCKGSPPVRQNSDSAKNDLVQSQGNERLSRDEQQKQALEVFNRILSISQSADNNGVRDRIADLYGQIIHEYPDAPLTQESYSRLIELYLKNYVPPRNGEALILYREFITKYPDSPLRNPVEGAFEQFYYAAGLWDDLLHFEEPAVKDFISTEKISNPDSMFFYSEAKYNLSDYREAYKGYKIVIKFFPESPDAKKARERIVQIKNTVSPINSTEVK